MQLDLFQLQDAKGTTVCFWERADEWHFLKKLILPNVYLPTSQKLKSSLLSASLARRIGENEWFKTVDVEFFLKG
ncbi:hypothetical protein [Pyramidobacter piscolens]|uniref:hypothetical protein n=1 Tax=Pyramidobacter piscolens TaxID=638849 RepID=UPI0026654470|nr:hypothetical protein [Pyramidobacter piscolens]